MRSKFNRSLVMLLAFALMITMIPFQVKAVDADTFGKQEKDVALKDGSYQVPIRLLKSNGDTESMGNEALVQKGKIIVENGEASLYFSFKKMNINGMDGYLSSFDVLNNIKYNENNYPIAYEKTPATVLSYFDVVDDYNKEDSSDSNCAGKEYPKQMLIPVDFSENLIWTEIYVPVMGSFNMGAQLCRLQIDYDKAVVYEEPDKTALEAAIKEAEAVKTDCFTKESAAQLQSALETAKEVKDSEYVIQTDVDSAATALKAAHRTMVAALEDGEYEISAVILKDVRDTVSMSNGILDNVKIAVKDSKVELSINVKPLTVTMGGESITSYAKGWRYLSGKDYVDAAVTAEDSEGNPTQFTYTMPESTMVTNISLNSIKWQEARLYLDFSNAKKVAAKPDNGEDKKEDTNTDAADKPEEPVETPATQATSISLNKKSVVLYTKGTKTIRLKAALSGSTKALTWSSSNTKVAAVNSAGKVTAKKAGKAVITVKAGNLSAVCKVTVKKPSLKIAKKKITIAKGKKVKIKVQAEPKGKLQYTCANKKIAKVSSKGVISAKNKGKTKITVSCNGVKQVVTVTVK